MKQLLSVSSSTNAADRMLNQVISGPTKSVEPVSALTRESGVGARSLADGALAIAQDYGQAANVTAYSRAGLGSGVIVGAIPYDPTTLDSASIVAAEQAQVTGTATSATIPAAAAAAVPSTSTSATLIPVPAPASSPATTASSTTTAPSLPIAPAMTTAPPATTAPPITSPPTSTSSSTASGIPEDPVVVFDDQPPANSGTP